MRFFLALLFLLPVACRTVNTNTSATKITHGISIPESKFPSVVLLDLQTEVDTAICTGTFVRDDLLLTAAHCMIDLDANNPGIYYARPKGTKADRKVKALRFVLHPKSRQNEVNEWDLALVYFPAGTAPAISPIAKSSVRIKDEVTLVGYGIESFLPDNGLVDDGAGYKRYATNEVYDLKDGFITLFGVPGRLPGVHRGERGIAGFGDSGGPLFKGSEVVGVVSGGEATGEAEAVSEYVDLSSRSSQEFLRANGL